MSLVENHPVFNSRSALSKSLGGRDELVGLGSTDNDLDLDRTTVNQKAVQLLEGPAGARSITERDVGDAAALRVGTV